MTLETTPDPTTTPHLEDGPVKRPRRRATRSVAAPEAVAGTPEAGEPASKRASVASVPGEPSAPAQQSAAETTPAPKAAAPAKARRAARRQTEGGQEAEATAALDVLGELGAGEKPATEAATAPRARRASRASGKAPAAKASAASGKASSAEGSADVESALNALLDVVVAERSGGADSGPAKASQAPRSRRSRTARSEAPATDAAADSVTVAEPATAPVAVAVAPESENAPVVEESKPVATSRRSGGRRKPAEQQGDRQQASEAPEAGQATATRSEYSATEDLAAALEAATKPRRNSRRRKVETPAEPVFAAPFVVAPVAESVVAEPVVAESQRSVAAASAPEPAAAPSDAAAASDAAAPSDAAAAAPAAGRRNRRSTRTVLFAEPQLGGDDGETVPAPDAAAAATTPRPKVSAEPDAADAALGRQPRRTRRNAKSSHAPSEDAASPEAPVASAGAQAAASSDAPAAPARLASTAVLFQAPDVPVRAKRRRATSPSGSPDEVRARLQPDEAAPDEDRSASPASRTAAGIDLTEELSALVEEAPEAVIELDEDGNEVVVEAEPAEDADVDDEDGDQPRRRRRRRGGRGRRSRSGAGDQGEDGQDDAESQQDGQEDAEPGPDAAQDDAESEQSEDGESSGSRRRRRRRRGGKAGESDAEETAPPAGRTARTRSVRSDEVTALKGSTRLEAKRQRRREGRDAGRRRQIITEAEFLARRESVERSMIVREKNGRTQIAVLEDNVLVEHYVSQQSQASMAGNVYLGRVQNVLPSMEAAFVDVGKGRNAVLYAGEVNWDAAGLVGQPRRIEQALKSGDSVLVQVTKDPIGHKGARLTSQVTLAGRYLVYVPGGGMTGISRKLPEPERARLKKVLREVVPESAGVIVRTAAEGASEEELKADIARLQAQWTAIEKKAKTASAPALLQGEPDMSIRVVRDIFNDDFSSLIVAGPAAWKEISGYVHELAPDLEPKLSRWSSERDVFAEHRIDEQLAKGMDRKVWLPSGGSLVIDRTEAMTVVDVNTGKFTGSGGTLEETVTRNNLEAAEEIVRQLRLRDIGGIVVIDFIDMVLESNRDLVLRRLVECLGRDRTKHQVAEVTSLGLVQMTRKRVGQGLVEAFSETCEHCHGRGFIVHDEPIEKNSSGTAPEQAAEQAEPAVSKKSRRRKAAPKEAVTVVPVLPEASSEAREAVKATLAQIAAAAAHAHDQVGEDGAVAEGAGAEDAASQGVAEDADAIAAPEPPVADQAPAGSAHEGA